MQFSCACMLFMIGVTLLNVVNAELIHCKRCNKHMKTCEKRLKTHKCFYSTFIGIPVPEHENDTTGSPPRNFRVTPFLLKKSNKTELAVNVTWSQNYQRKCSSQGTIIDFCDKSLMIKSFLRESTCPCVKFIHKQPLEIKITGHHNALAASLIIKINSSNFIKDKQYTDFSLLYHNEYSIKPGYEYYCNMMSLPLYHSDTNIKEVDFHGLKILGCKEKGEEYSALKFCKWEEKDRERGEKRRKEKELAASVSLAAIIIPTIIVFMLILLAVLGACGAASQKLLIVVNTIDEAAYLDAGNKLASLLGNQHAFNLWKKQDVNCNPTEWVQNHLKECDHVLFICTPQGKSEAEKLDDSSPMTYDYLDEFALVYHKVLGNEKLPFTCVYFDVTADCVPAKLKKGRCFQLPEKIDKFLLHTNGKNASDFSGKIEELRQQLNAIREKSIGNCPNTEQACEDSETAPMCSNEFSAPTVESLKSCSLNTQDSGICVA